MNNAFWRFARHPVVRGSITVLGGSMIANIFAYAYHLVMGRILGPAAYGELAALLSLFYILNVPSAVIQTTLTKFFSVLRAKKQYGEVKTLYVNSIKFIVIGELICLPAVWLFSGMVASFLRISSPMYLYLLYGIFASYLVTVVAISAIAAFQMFFVSSILANAGAFLRLSFGILGAYFGVAWVLASNLFSNLVTVLLYFIPLRFVFKKRARQLKSLPNGWLAYSGPTLLITLAVTALYSQDVILVKHFFQPVDAGIYSSLSVLGKIIFYASFALSFVLFPVIAERKELGKEKGTLVWSALAGVSALSFGLTVLYYLFPSFIVQALYGKSFDAAIPYVGKFGLFISFYTLVSLLTTVLLADGRTKTWIPVTVAAILQLAGIWLVHGTLSDVIMVNTTVTLSLLAVLLIYYGHVKDKS